MLQNTPTQVALFCLNTLPVFSKLSPKLLQHAKGSQKKQSKTQKNRFSPQVPESNMPGFLINNLCLNKKLAMVPCLLIPSCALTAQIWSQAFKSCPVWKNPWSVPQCVCSCFCECTYTVTHLPICLVYHLLFPVNEQFGMLTNISLESYSVTLAQYKFCPQYKISKGENENLAYKQHIWGFDEHARVMYYHHRKTQLLKRHASQNLLKFNEAHIYCIG